MVLLGAAAGAGYSMVKVAGVDAPNIVPLVKTLDQAVARAAESLHLTPRLVRDDDESSAAAIGPESITQGPLYNCSMPKETVSWSVTKKAWCCMHEDIACPLFNCAIGELGMWPVEKTDWCCKNERRGCPSGSEDK